LAKSTCVACSEVFFSISGFNMHRVGGYGDAIYSDKQVIGYTKPDRRCLSPLEMASKGMGRNKRGLWSTGLFDASMFEKKGSEE